jgi:glycosyltransferase 2 family protein
VITHLSRSLWIRSAITAIVLAIMLSRISVAQVLDVIARVRPEMVVSVLVLLAADRAVMIWRWVILLRATGQRIATKSAAWIYLVSSFVGGFLPAGIGADLARAYTLSQRTSGTSAAAASVAVDRLLGLLSIVLVGIFGIVVGGRWTRGSRDVWAFALAAALVAIGMAAVLWADRWIVLMPVRWTQTTIGRRMQRLASALSEYREHRIALVSVSMLSIGVQLLRIVQAWLLGIGIGLTVPFAYYLFFMPIGLVALMLPISISGFGAPQGIIVWMLRPVGVADADAFALSTLIVLSGIVANLPGAWLYLRRAPGLAART